MTGQMLNDIPQSAARELIDLLDRNMRVLQGVVIPLVKADRQLNANEKQFCDDYRRMNTILRQLHEWGCIE